MLADVAKEELRWSYFSNSHLLCEKIAVISASEKHVDDIPHSIKGGRFKKLMYHLFYLCKANGNIPAFAQPLERYALELTVRFV
jgi:hypothetical protein